MRSLRTITVAELTELLQDQEPTAKVVFAADYGDHCHTMQALPLRGDIEEVTVAESGYSTSGFAIVDEDEDDDHRDSDSDETFLVIR